LVLELGHLREHVTEIPVKRLQHFLHSLKGVRYSVELYGGVIRATVRNFLRSVKRFAD
jgi:hypothetical protein